MTKKTVKILIATGIFPPSVGGPATYSKLLADELPKRGIPVTVVSFDAVRKYPKVIRHLFYIMLLLRHSKGITHIYAQDPVSVGFPALIVSFVTRKKFWIRIAGDYAWEQSRQRFGVSEGIDEFQEKKYGLRVELLRKLQVSTAKRADQVIVPSDYFKKLVGAWDKKVNVTRIYNGIELPKLVYTQEEMREKFDIPTDSQVIVSAGRLVPWKGFDGLLRVVKKLSEKNLDKKVKLYILGDGPDMKKLQQQVVELSLEKLVSLVGFVDRETMFSYMVAADIFVLNTTFESFSFQVVEAMHAGTPVITNAVGSLPELITQDKEGVLIASPSEEKLERSILSVLNDQEKKVSMGNEGKKKAQEFSIGSTLDALVSELQHSNSQK